GSATTGSGSGAGAGSGSGSGLDTTGSGSGLGLGFISTVNAETSSTSLCTPSESVTAIVQSLYVI
ncbi:MAG TPA: hypothetical protein DCG23_08800, partial [Deltaproteobacteria bacterium]|nr:hypothetical protein [Deltaproteobacteria bacterium]